MKIDYNSQLYESSYKIKSLVSLFPNFTLHYKKKRRSEENRSSKASKLIVVKGLHQMKSVETLSSNPEIFSSHNYLFNSQRHYTKCWLFQDIRKENEIYYWRTRLVGSSSIIPINLIAIVCYLIRYEIAIQTWWLREWFKDGVCRILLRERLFSCCLPHHVLSPTGQISEICGCAFYIDKQANVSYNNFLLAIVRNYNARKV